MAGNDLDIATNNTMDKQILNNFDIYASSALNYGENHSCLKCNKLKYICLYKQLYKRIKSGDATPKELLGIQRRIFNAIVELQEEKDCEFFNIEDVIHMLRMLVVMALQIYVIGTEPYDLVSLNEDQNYSNDLFNIKETGKLLLDAEISLKNKNAYIIVSDLCLGNLQFGDLLVNDGHCITGVEVKGGKKNKKIGKLVLKGKRNPYDKERNHKDWKHFERIKRQWKRMETIIDQEEATFYVNNLKLIFPYWVKDFDSYKDVFSKTLKEAGKKLYNEVAVDENITIITINRFIYQMAKRNCPPPCLYQELRHLTGCPINEEEINKIEAFDNLDKHGNNIYLYNSVLWNYSAPQPYLWQASDTLMLDLIEMGCEIYIKINMDALFDYLRRQGLKVFPMKRKPVSDLLVFKGKNWVAEYGPYGFDCATIFSKDTIQRITYGMYTSRGLADFLKEYSEEVEVVSKYIHAMEKYREILDHN